MRTKRFRYFESEGGYDLSISDLMSALCCIFILVTVSIVASLKEKNLLADKYQELQQDLFLDLSQEMGNDLNKWGATIDPETLTIRFSSDDGFDARSPELKNGYKKVLQEFFPKLVSVLQQDKYKNEIEEIRIEGFTAPDRLDPYGEGSEHDYTSGIELSQQRTMNVLLYCLEHTNYSQESDSAKQEAEKEWIRKHIVSNGYSLSRPLGDNGKLIEEKRKLTDAEKSASRRVEFRIKTNSDKIVQQFQNVKE
ncbi:MAG: hypothetical protein L6V90_03670 [Treponema succinifaciens]|nr:MAG: hypothetical protein L6V90_03670 [Treponema succinifaciens]